MQEATDHNATNEEPDHEVFQVRRRTAVLRAGSAVDASAGAKGATAKEGSLFPRRSGKAALVHTSLFSRCAPASAGRDSRGHRSLIEHHYSAVVLGLERSR